MIRSDLQTVWDFFSSPSNLKEITPDHMGFDVMSELPDKMYEGMMIEYKVKPLLGIPMTWISEIKAVKELSFFVDEQRKGPYKIWHHEHHFIETEEGVEVIDIVSYELPLGVLGRMVHSLLVKRKLEQIFEHRFKVLNRLFDMDLS